MRPVVLCVVPSLILLLSGPLQAAPAPPKRAQAGRYQMVVGMNRTIYVLDTATGQCWSKAPNGRWIDEGSPARPKRDRAESPLTLALPGEKVELTVKQRRSKPIPGSDDRILLCLDDITGGQVLISVRGEDGRLLLDDVSVKQGDVVSFKVGRETFYLHAKELKNFLTGDDIGIFEIASRREMLRAPEEGEENEEGAKKITKEEDSPD